MKQYPLSQLLINRDFSLLKGSLDTPVSDISYDSRKVQNGTMFFAIPGIHTDGHGYIPAALHQGAGTIVINKKADQNLLELFDKYPATLISVPDTREALAWVSREWYGRPDQELSLIGVTGTDGKSSTVWYIQQLFNLMNYNSGFLSTVAMQTGSNTQDNTLRQSTPESPEVFSLLRSMVGEKKSYGVIESTSHGLSAKTARLAAISFQTGVFTNISHEHLEFHGSFEQYLHDKANLFRKLKSHSKKPAIRPAAVINAQCLHTGYLIQAAQDSNSDPDILLYGCENKIPESNKHLHLTLEARDIKLLPNGSTFRVVFKPNTPDESERQIQSTIPGSFTIENLLAAVLGVYGQTGADIWDIFQCVPQIQGVKGRMRIIQAGQPFTVIVDYAHTPGSFEIVFPMFRDGATGKLIGVFGSGGERDVEKRPIQGQIAGRYADILIITNEDPRLENPETIIKQIAGGVDNPGCKVLTITDRRSAIRKAFELAEPGDTVALLGKGHEQSIILDSGKIPWDEETVAYEELASMGFRMDRITK